MSEQMGFTYTGLKQLEDTEKFLSKYNSFIVKKFITHSKKSRDVLDFGAGIGTLANLWKEFEHSSSIRCLELDTNQVRVLKERGFEVIFDIPNKEVFDYVFTSNVLEHIEDDRATLESIFHCLRKGGGLGIFVPANQILYSKLDEKLGHFRRYKKSEIVQKVEFSGFKVDTCHYVDCLGFFALAIAKLISLNLANINTEKVNLYGKVIWPIARLLDIAGAKYLFGKNLLILASKN